MKKILMFVVVLVAFSTLFAQEGKLHMTPKVGIGFAFSSWNMIGLTAGFDTSYRVLTIKKKPGMGLYVGGEIDFTAWPPINTSSLLGANFEIPILGTVRFQIPVKKVMITPFVQTGVAVLFWTGGSAFGAPSGSASAGFAFNMGAEFLFKKKFVLRPHLNFIGSAYGSGWLPRSHPASFMVDFGYRIAK